jgi:hypothetical protein
MADQCGWSEIHAWVAAHRDALPHTLAELARYPMAYRRAIHGALSSEERVALWREHLASFLGPGSNLSAVQSTLLRQAIDDLPALMSDDRAETQARLRDLEHRMSGVFSRDELRPIVATLGPDEPPEGLPAPAW